MYSKMKSKDKMIYNGFWEVALISRVSLDHS